MLMMSVISQHFVHIDIHLPSCNLHHQVTQLAMLGSHAEWGLALFVLNLLDSMTVPIGQGLLRYCL